MKGGNYDTAVSNITTNKLQQFVYISTWKKENKYITLLQQIATWKKKNRYLITS